MPIKRNNNKSILLIVSVYSKDTKKLIYHEDELPGSKNGTRLVGNFLQSSTGKY